MHYVLGRVLTSIHKANCASMGVMFNSFVDLQVLRKLCIIGNLMKAPQIYLWPPPLPRWLKVKIDGSTEEALGLSGRGGFKEF